MQSLKRRLESARRNLQPFPDTPIPIALTITDLDVGGAERAMTSLVLGLDRRRWAPEIVNLSGEGELAAVIRDAGVPVTSLDLSRGNPAAGVVKLGRALNRRRPKLVQSFMFHANVLTRLATPLAGRPWLLGGLRVAEREKAWHLACDRLTSRLACGSICVSSGVLRFSVDRGGLDPDRLTVIPNGVDVERFDRAIPVDRASIGVSHEAFLGLVVGRLDVQKGLPDLLEALEKLDQKTPWQVAIVGDGPLKGWLEEQIDTRPRLSGRVIRLGRRPDVPALMKSADLLIHAAHWEGMPNVVLEAMAASLPVVATDVEGIEELIVPEETGRVVPVAAPDALAAAIRSAMSDRETGRQRGMAGRRRVERDFSIPRMIARYEELWAHTLGFAIVP